MSRGEGELLTVPKPRAVGLLAVCPTVKPVGEPDALIGHVRFDERGCETERCRMAEATALILDSTVMWARGAGRAGRAPNPDRDLAISRLPLKKTHIVAAGR